VKFALRVESPIHVGNGEHLAWLDYFVHAGTLHVVDWGALVEAASSSRTDVAERLAAFCDRGLQRIEAARGVISKARGRERQIELDKLRDDTSPVRFASDELKDGALATRMRDGAFDRYRATFHGGRFDRRLQIRTQSKDAMGRPTIPGTVLKGQIRTALAHTVLTRGDEDTARTILEGGAGLPGWKRTLDEATPGRARFMFADEVEAAVFRVPADGRQGWHVRLDDPRRDVLRFLHVSDPVRAHGELVVLRSSPFNLAPSAKDGGRGPLVPLAPVMMEAIVEGSEFEFEIRVDASTLRRLAADGESGHAGLRTGLWPVFQRLFGVTREEVRELDDAAVEERVLSAIEVSLATRMTAVVARENAWLDAVHAPHDSALREFIESYGSSSIAAVPLRIGSGAGLHANTVLCALDGHPA